MKRTLFCILTITCFLLSACADNTNTASNTSSSAAPVLHKTKSGITYQVFDKPISDKVSLDYTVLAKDQDPLIITVTMIDESDESKGIEYHGYTLRENGWEDTALPWGSAFNKQFPQGPSFISGDSNGLIYISVVDPQKGIRLFQMGNSEDYKEIDLSEINKAYKDYDLVDIQFVTDEEIQKQQEKLNQVYDTYTAKYGVIGSNANKRAFSDDSSYCLLCSLEDLNEDGTLKRKADMFTKRTIKKAVAVTSVETATEALALSLNERAKVDLPYMAKLTGKTEEKITEELVGVIFKNPLTDQWESGDEYLSGNVRDKLNTARTFAENHPEFTPNVRALVQGQCGRTD